jgi:hypothetical protein
VTWRAVEWEVENGETGEMEQYPGTPCQCGVCKGERAPLLPGDPDRHDAGAGDNVTIAIVEVV